MRKIIGATILIHGIVIASIAAAPTPPIWGPFILGLVITVIGGLLARSQAPAKASAAGSPEEEMTLDILLEHLKSIGDDLPNDEGGFRILGLLKLSNLLVHRFYKTTDSFQQATRF